MPGPLVKALCVRAGLEENRIDVSGLWGAVEGYVIAALESPRATLTTLARHFGFDAVETEGVIAFRMRGGPPAMLLEPGELVRSAEGSGDAFELTRAQETELPQILKWSVPRADEDYDAIMVEARRITVDTARIQAEVLPIVVSPEEAERRCRRALLEVWTARETAAFSLPPSKLALDATDAIALSHDGRLTDYRLTSVGDAFARPVEAVRQDRDVYDLPPGAARPARLQRPTVFGAGTLVFLDLPQLVDGQSSHRPLVAATATPKAVALYRSRLFIRVSRARPMVGWSCPGHGRIAT